MKSYYKVVLGLILGFVIFAVQAEGIISYAKKDNTQLPTQLVSGRTALAFITVSNNLNNSFDPLPACTGDTAKTAFFIVYRDVFQPDFSDDSNYPAAGDYKGICGKDSIAVCGPYQETKENGWTKTNIYLPQLYKHKNGHTDTCTLKLKIMTAVSVTPNDPALHIVNSGGRGDRFFTPPINVVVTDNPAGILSLPDHLVAVPGADTTLRIYNPSTTVAANNIIIDLSSMPGLSLVSRPAACDDLMPGQYCYVVVHADSSVTLPGSIQAYASNTPETPYSVNVIATDVGNVSANDVTFNTPGTQTFTITNHDSSAVTLTSIRLLSSSLNGVSTGSTPLSGNSIDLFGEGTCISNTLAASASCAINFDAAVDADAQNAYLEVQYTDANSQSFTLVRQFKVNNAVTLVINPDINDPTQSDPINLSYDNTQNNPLATTPYKIQVTQGNGFSWNATGNVSLSTLGGTTLDADAAPSGTCTGYIATYPNGTDRAISISAHRDPSTAIPGDSIGCTHFRGAKIGWGMPGLAIIGAD